MFTHSSQHQMNQARMVTSENAPTCANEWPKGRENANKRQKHLEKTEASESLPSEVSTPTAPLSSFKEESQSRGEELQLERCTSSTSSIGSKSASGETVSLRRHISASSSDLEASEESEKVSKKPRMTYQDRNVVHECSHRLSLPEAQHQRLYEQKDQSLTSSLPVTNDRKAFDCPSSHSIRRMHSNDTVSHTGGPVFHLQAPPQAVVIDGQFDDAPEEEDHSPLHPHDKSQRKSSVDALLKAQEIREMRDGCKEEKTSAEMEGNSMEKQKPPSTILISASSSNSRGSSPSTSCRSSPFRSDAVMVQNDGVAHVPRRLSLAEDTLLTKETLRDSQMREHEAKKSDEFVIMGRGSYPENDSYNRGEPRISYHQERANYNMYIEQDPQDRPRLLREVTVSSDGGGLNKRRGSGMYENGEGQAMEWHRSSSPHPPHPPSAQNCPPDHERSYMHSRYYPHEGHEHNQHYPHYPHYQQHHPQPYHQHPQLHRQHSRDGPDTMGASPSFQLHHRSPPPPPPRSMVRTRTPSVSTPSMPSSTATHMMSTSPLTSSASHRQHPHQTAAGPAESAQGDDTNASSSQCSQLSGDNSPVENSSCKQGRDHVTVLNDNDVLCGRGKGVNDYVGNKRFRTLVRRYREEYLHSSRGDKTNIARLIVEIVRQQSPPGRFLKRVSGSSAAWYVVEKNVALEKTSQALREGSPRHSVMAMVTSSSPGSSNVSKGAIRQQQKKHAQEVRRVPLTAQVRPQSAGMIQEQTAAQEQKSVQREENEILPKHVSP